jgi:NAD(P)-dependent dehydrogenase (short-subunit alcohol dehydrogenase family)
MQDHGFLAGRTALVTGSSRNLGAVIAERLAARGATVAVTYRQSEAEARELAARLGTATGRRHVAVAGDLADAGQVRRLVGAAAEELGGRIDVLVHNAGPFSMTPFVELDEAEWDEIWNVNVRAAHVATKIVAPAMRESGWGRIVLLSAGSAYLRNHSIYGLAKQAVSFLAEELALELGPQITVNAVAPGQIAESAEDIAEHDPSFVERAIRATPAARLVTRAEVGELVARLCGPEFDMVTGATLPVDGGWRLQRF